MAPAVCAHQAPIPPPSYHRAMAMALHVDALTLVRCLHLLALCRLTVHLAHHQCPPPLPAGPGGAPRIYTEESLVRLALLRTLRRRKEAAQRIMAAGKASDHAPPPTAKRGSEKEWIPRTAATTPRAPVTKTAISSHRVQRSSPLRAKHVARRRAAAPCQK
jgi:hypothetical protein